jgi:hypothetical protein
MSGQTGNFVKQLRPIAARAFGATILMSAMVTLTACQKATEVVAQKALEKSMESQMKDGGATEAKVDLSSGTFKTTSVDKDGKTQQFEMGNASAVTEADVGLPFYPGATVDKQHVIKSVSNTEMTVLMPLETPDSSDKVAAFYRDRMKAMSAGRQFMDMAQGEGSFTMMLIDEAKGESIQVMVSPGKDGEPSKVLLNASRKKQG